ncbi:CPBP family glutamic-type intramembrane protease [Cellulomonas sp. P5_E12]
MPDTLDTLHALDVPTATALVLVLAATALVALDPVLGRRQHRRLVHDLAAADDEVTRDAVRRRFYRSWTWLGWLAGAVAVALVLALPGVGVAELGLRLPHLGGLSEGGDDALAMVLGAAVGLALSAGALAVVLRRSSARVRPVLAAVDVMLPTTPAARRGWAGLAVSAGVTEEITYRGLVVLALAVGLPSLGHGWVVAAAAALFGVAHWYQGRLGMLATGALGAVFAQLYLLTGSLLLPMVLHLLVDLRPLLTRTRPDAPVPADA